MAIDCKRSLDAVADRAELVSLGWADTEASRQSDVAVAANSLI